ncbi:MAG: tRNA (adenosine(37)-N6)-threonylcarbamoyltransferase complex dimerization subunit type 1 TsaB [Chloroflexi bacterium]|nr:tRNA (adenosine(37)-N6)-threonylcarbamoyltransferase complex dimerization subunit type 1 TsaB [Chloroflexota bacterium]
MELAIDTSTAHASIALSHHGELKAEVYWHAGQNHTVELVPHLIHLFEQNDTDIHRIEALMVAKGPGSFNGLRVGLATAKGLAFTLGIPLVCIGTLETTAYAHADAGFPIRPILQAGRGEIATAVFTKDDGQWTKSFAEYVTTIDDLCSTVKEQNVFCGEIKPEQLAQLQKKLGDIVVFKESSPFSRASYLAELGWCRIEAGYFDDPSTIQPFYLKKPSITKPRRRKHDAMSNMRK